MTIEKIKLKDLDDNQLVSYPDAHYVITVLELKELFDGLTYEDKEWYTVESRIWNPDANYMIESYIENEYQELYEDWDVRANDCITDEAVKKIQEILDEIFNDVSVKNYWSLEKKIEI